VSEHDGNSIEQARDSSLTARDERKPYRKPSFRSEQVFETMALQCGKVGPTSQACIQSRSAS
jgi:hypothetical protein